MPKIGRSPRQWFKIRPAPNRAIDLARQAKLIAPADAKTPTERRLQELWFRSPNRMDFEDVDTPGGVVGKQQPVVKVKAAHLRPGDMYYDATEGVVRIRKVSPIDPRAPKSIEVSTSKGARRLPVSKVLHISRPPRMR